MIIHFPAYRRYGNARIEGNDTTIALLIGARISKQMLKTYQAENSAFLPSIFNTIPSITRLNRTPDDVAQLLENAERHFAYMALPYALAIHGSLLVDAAIMLKGDGHEPQTLKAYDDLYNLKLSNAHEYIADCSEYKFDEKWLSLFNFSRCVRNRIIHHAGSPGSHLRTMYNDLEQEAREEWERLAKRSFRDVLKEDYLDLDERELIAVLAISLRLAEEVNRLLGQTIRHATWAMIAVKDYKQNYPKQYKNNNSRIESLAGYTRSLYGPLNLSNEELSSAVDRLQ